MLSNQELSIILEISKKKIIPAGHSIITEGQKGDALYYLAAGSVDVKKTWPNSGTLEIATLFAGDLFGEISLLSGSARTAQVTAIAESTVFVIPYSKLQDLLDKHPEIAVKLYRLLAVTVTDKLNRTTDQLLESGSLVRLAALGELAAHTAHEIGTPLATALIVTEQVYESLVMGEELPSAAMQNQIGTIKDALNHVLQVVQLLKSSSRNDAVDPAVSISVNDLLREALALCQARFHQHRVQITVSETPREAVILGHPRQVIQILINLLNNAMEAAAELPAPWVRMDTSEDEKFVFISVTDSGPGVPQQLRSKIFDSFFTTKPASKGTGLGLSISRKLARDLGGDLFLDTDSNHTRFSLRISKP